MTAPHAKRRAVLIAWSAIADDPRVRRMGDALCARGWEVTGLGHAGARSAPPDWPILTTSPMPTRRTDLGALARAERVAGKAGAAILLPAELAARAARPRAGLWLRRIRLMLNTEERPLRHSVRIAADVCARFSAPRRTLLERRLVSFHRLAPQLAELEALAISQTGPALFIANDWWTLPAAARGADAVGGAVVYDSHELAGEEYAHDPIWREFQKPIIDAIEGEFIRRAAFVTSVSAGIAERLASHYALDAQTATLRNAPEYQATAFRPTGERVRALYHGILAEGRGLEAAIDSVASWREEFSLHIRGPASPADYADVLRRRAAAAGVADRVVFHEPVPVGDLVRAAAPFEIGLMALPGHSDQNRHALPNKLFEYLMAGLALAVTDLPEMARLVSETKAGVTIADATPAAIAAAINGLNRPALDVMRRRALEAAKTLNWENESPPVIAAYERIYDERARRAAA
jgi:glycosyltransferase involved in cell wall biosynthesis